MTLMMDGVVRKASVMPTPVVASKPTSVLRAEMTRPQRHVVGMDGIRRLVPSAPVTPREVVANIQQAALAAVPAAAVLEAPRAPWAMPQLPAWQVPRFGWRRPVAAFGLVATALVASGLAVHALATPRTTTARAESPAKATNVAAPTPLKAAPLVAPTPQKTGLQQILDGFTAAHTAGQFSIVVKDMKTGETASVNPDREMTSASLYKLFVAQRIYQQIDIGQLDYSQPAGGGTGRNVDQCLNLMITISDNGCGRALGSILRWGAQDQALQAEGYKETTLATPQQTSASDVAKMFSRLYNGTLVSSNSSQRFTDLLKNQRVNNRLPVGLPAGTIMAHKTGDLDGYVHDSGIVYGPKTNYLVVVTSGPWSAPGNAPSAFADLSQQLWNYFEN